MKTGRFAAVLLIATALAGCGVFKGGKPKTTLLGDRIAVLTSENSAELDPSIAAVPVTVPPSEANDSWTQSGGNAQKSMGNVALKPTLARAWTVSIAGSSKQVRLAAAPVVAGNRVYVMDTEAVVRAIDAATGGVVWSSRLTDPAGNERSLFGGGVSVDGDRLYATNGVGDVVSLEAATGKVVWKKRPGGPLRGAPTVSNGNVYVVSPDNQLFALNQATGETIWNESGTLEAAGVFGVAAPAAAQGTVVAGFSSGELTAYRYENGRAVWQDALSRTSISTAVSTLSDIDADPVIDGGRVYAVGEGGRMVALELTTGQRLWELNVSGIATPSVVGDWIFVVTDDARMLCIQRATGRIRWISQLPRWRNEEKKKGLIGWTGPVLAGDRLLVVNTQGEMASVTPADGKISAPIEAGKAFYLPPVVAGNTLFLLDNDGKLSAWR
ncbi:outer membrane protein assembly factor BamB family protein [Sphingomonas prati]|uniref:Outer membrane protein assembly factor BamB n=1 Tax=Sphingomonas prati TaxID=1843237 RepID=A0A7W9F216_9SPHN|nr:PQQ-binding-like beta-propeller repeat protein [Sphingomonas prati]MBB5729903.1 outer membrane protein assembly factor BamB [Sphingomonas prati]GGE88660.1 outer membrane protein assembly factor BamB [Sphingomonas prati]